MTRWTTWAALGVLVFAPAEAWAMFTMEYHTYNAFTETRDAFQRLALVMSDPTLMTLAASFVVAGALIGAMMFVGKGLAGQGGNPMGWVVTLLIGSVIFIAFVVPKATVQIYDPVQNRTEAVSGVPQIIVLVAGVFNAIERNVVQVVDTGSANPYADSGGIVEFIVNHSALRTGISDLYLARSLGNYYEDCGVPMMGRGINGASEAKFRRAPDGDDQATEWAKWVNPAMYTTVYDNNGLANAATCTQAWGALGPQVNASGSSSMVGQAIEAVCRSVGLADTAATIQRCNDSLGNAGLLYGVPGSSPEQLMRSILLSKAVVRAWERGDYGGALNSMIDRQVMAEGIGAAAAMDQWQPKLRGYLLSITLGMTLLPLLLVVTPAVWRALMLVVGMFAWLTLWGISDALALRAAVDAGIAAMEHAARYGLGLEGILAAPEGNVRALGLFGQARTNALMLATFLSAALFGFGGYAFTSMAGRHADHLNEIGERSGRQTFLPEEQAAFQQQMAMSRGMARTMGTYGFENTAASMTNSQFQGATQDYIGAAGNGVSVSDMAYVRAAREGFSEKGQFGGITEAGGGDFGRGLESMGTGTQARTTQQISRDEQFSDVVRNTDLGLAGSARVEGAGEAVRPSIDQTVADRLGVDASTGAGALELGKMRSASQIGEAESAGSSDASVERYRTEHDIARARTTEIGDDASTVGRSQGFEEATRGGAVDRGRSAAGDDAFIAAAERDVGQRIGAGQAADQQPGGAMGFGSREGGAGVARSAADLAVLERATALMGLNPQSVSGWQQASEARAGSNYSMTLSGDQLNAVTNRLMAQGALSYDQAQTLRQAGSATFDASLGTDGVNNLTARTGSEVVARNNIDSLSGSSSRHQRISTSEVDLSRTVAGGEYLNNAQERQLEMSRIVGKDWIDGEVDRSQLQTFAAGWEGVLEHRGIEMNAANSREMFGRWETAASVTAEGRVGTPLASLAGVSKSISVSGSVTASGGGANASSHSVQLATGRRAIAELANASIEHARAEYLESSNFRVPEDALERRLVERQIMDRADQLFSQSFEGLSSNAEGRAAGPEGRQRSGIEPEGPDTQPEPPRPRGRGGRGARGSR